MTTTRANRSRTERIGVRTSPAERAIIDQAVAAAGTDLTTFVITSLTIAARRVLANHTTFTLDADAAHMWDAINDRPARDLPGLQALMDCPSPFVDA